MFKKFKDKLAEEMKQSPARLQASMQQLAQAVVSPSLSNNSIQDLSFNDNFSLTEEIDETPKNSPVKHRFQTIDLTSPSIKSSTSRSSVCSNVSDISFLFPIYESSGNMYHLQSDMDQSASEIDDNISLQLDNTSKEQLYSAYCKARVKYNKYRGKFTDLVTHYREIEHAKIKLESLLVETQDKALRRISDLKEQCQLEQQAKAHLEDVLRNDIEEKDHVINSLKIKIKLLQEKSTSDESLEYIELFDSCNNDKVNILMNLSNNTDSEKSSEELYKENIQLKEKIEKMDSFLEKYKNMLKRNKNKILEVTNEKNTLERDYDILQKLNQEKYNSMEKQLFNSQEKIINLKEEIDILKKREEESVISLAENKLSIHRELEGKEELIKQLQLELKQMLDIENSLKETIEKQKHELEKVKLVANENAEVAQEHIRGKSEALKQMQLEMQQKLIDLEEKMNLRYHNEVSKNKELLLKLEGLEQQPKVIQYQSEEIQKITLQLQEKMNFLVEVHTEKEEYKRVIDECKMENIHLREELIQVINTLETFEIDTNTCDNVLTNDYEKKLNELKQDLANKNYNEFNLRIQKYIEKFKQYQYKVQMQEEEILILKSKTDFKKMLELQNELENKNTELLKLTIELKSYSNNITDFKKEISSLVNCRNNFNEYLKTCKKTLKCLRHDHESLKNNVNNNIFNGKSALLEIVQEISKVFPFFYEVEANLKIKVNELSEKVKLMEKLKIHCNDSTIQLEQVLNQKIILENELKDKYNEIEDMKMKMKNFNELEAKNITFVLEIETLQSKFIELHKLNNDREKLLNKVKLEKENFVKNISLEKQQHETVLYDLNMKISENISLNDKLSILSKKYKEAKDIVKTLKSESKDCNNLIKEIQIFKLELNSIKQELEEKKIQVKNLQIKSNEEEEKSFQLNSECEIYKKRLEENNQKLSHFNKEVNNSKEINTKLNIELNEYKDSLQQIINNKNILKAELEKEKLKLKSAESEWNESINIKINENEELRNCNLQLMAELKNLKINENILNNLKSEKSIIIRELHDSKSLQNLLSNENKRLQDNQNDLLTLNKVLKHSQSELIEKLHSLEDKNSDMANEKIAFLKEIECCKYQIQNNNLEMEKLKKQFEEIKNRNIEMTTLLGEANDYHQKNINLIDEVQNLNRINSSLTSKVESFQNKILNLTQCQEKSENLKFELETCKSKITELENSLSLKTQKLNSFEALQIENDNLKIELKEKNIEIKKKELQNVQFLDKIDKSLLKLDAKETTQEINKWQETVNKLENSLSDKESEMNILREKYTKLEESINNLHKETLKNEELNNNIEIVILEKTKLESQLDETLFTFQAKESQMKVLQDELKNQVIRLRKQIKINEEEQSLRLKQIVKEFQAQLHDKDKELQAALEKRFEHQQNYKSDIIQEYKEQLKDFQIELIKKSEQIERLIFDNEQIKRQMEEELEKRLTNITQIKLEHIGEMHNLEKKWKHIIKQKTNQIETKYEQEIAELTNEWQNERKSDENTELLDKELKNTARVAMAAVQSNTSSFHTLQQALLSQKKELTELRKLVKMRQESVEDSTEIEYLRNILYKYMMGKETMVLAKVIAAVVKFDQEQTSKILKKEEDKLSLLGSLGLT